MAFVHKVQKLAEAVWTFIIHAVLIKHTTLVIVFNFWLSGLRYSASFVLRPRMIGFHKQAKIGIGTMLGPYTQKHQAVHI